MKTILTFIAILLPLLPLYARSNDEPLHYRLKIADKTLPPLKRIEYADSLRRVQPSSADSLLLLQAHLAYENGYFRGALRFTREYRRLKGEEFRSLPASRQCDVMFMEVKSCFNAGEYADGIEMAHELLGMSKPDSLLYYDINAITITGDYISEYSKETHSEKYSLSNYIRRGERMLCKARERGVPANTIARMRKALLFSKMLNAIDSGKYKEAQKYGAEMLEYPVTEIEKTALEGNMALIYHKLGDLDMASQYYLRVISDGRHHYNHAVCLYNYMQLLISQDRPEEALRILDEHPEIIMTAKGIEYEAKLLREKSYALYEAGRPDEAFSTLLRARYVEDSVSGSRIRALSGKYLEALENGVEMKKDSDSAIRGFKIWAITATAISLLLAVFTALRLVRRHTQATRDDADGAPKSTDNGGSDEESAADVLRLVSLNETIASIGATVDDKTLSDGDKLSRIKGELKEIASYDDLWQLFHIQFEKLHPSFFSRLKREYPDLTAGETRMCSYVMLNMTNKEIAALTRRNIRSVETMRYRLTKKMHLEEGTSLSARLFALADTAAKG